MVVFSFKICEMFASSFVTKDLELITKFSSFCGSYRIMDSGWNF